MEPITFSFALHQKAEKHFRWNFDIDELLAVFRTKVGKRGLGWLKNDWKTGEDEDATIGYATKRVCITIVDEYHFDVIPSSLT